MHGSATATVEGFRRRTNQTGLNRQRRLLTEIARLRRECARAEDIAARHATMLREGDHRIKNSLQIVSSLMALQASREMSPPAKEALLAAAARIQSVARIHDALQASCGQDFVALGETIQTMCQSLQAMAGDARSVEVIVTVEPIEAPVSFAQPLVLAINELVVNALRHAFDGDRAGTIRITVKRVDGELHAVVADDGKGLPANDSARRGYGTRLVHMMAEQIGGSVTVESKAGACYTIRAPLPALRQAR
jgi:two-component system, sensor histidine kinase PdtaS